MTDPCEEQKPVEQNSASPLCYAVWELLEVEYWEDQWNAIGLFTSRELAEEARRERESMLRREFDESVGKFGDWYSWTVTKRQLSGNSGELVTA